MRSTTVRCDRCGSEIEAEGSTLAPDSGPLRRRRGPTPVDLCDRCTADFLAWLAPELKPLEPTGATAPAVASA